MYQTASLRQIRGSGRAGTPTEERHVTNLMEHLRHAVLRDGAGLGDGELLDSFIACHDGAALAALIRRHGPMVWGVCRRMLAHHDAEDAFQATFLVLVRKAASVVPRAMVANWLYGVAHQTALHVRRTAARRRAREVQVAQMPDTEAVWDDQWSDVWPVLDEELNRLPDIYRAVVVLCDLEGRTRKDVARELGVPEGTVGGRLARARALLAKQFSRRGTVLSGGALAVVLSARSASASPSLVASTAEAARLLAAGRAAGIVSAKVAALTEGVVKTMFATKIKGVLAVMLATVALCGATELICRTQAGEPPKAQKARDENGADAEKGKRAKADSELLQGKWQIVSSTYEGRERKYAEDEEVMTFKKSSVLHSEPGGKLHLRFRLDETKKPKTIDAIVLGGEDLFDLTDLGDLDQRLDKRLNECKEQIQGLYLIDGETLKLCIGGKLGERPSDFEGKEGSNSTLYILKKVR